MSRTIKKKDPVTADIMKRLFQRFNNSDSTLKDLRLLAMCSVSYAGFLIYDELSNLKANNLTFREDYLDIL